MLELSLVTEPPNQLPKLFHPLFSWQFWQLFWQSSSQPPNEPPFKSCALLDKEPVTCMTWQLSQTTQLTMTAIQLHPTASEPVMPVIQ